MIWSVLLKPRYLCWDCSVHLFLPENHPLCFAFDTASVNCIWCPLGQNYDFPLFFFHFPAPSVKFPWQWDMYCSLSEMCFGMQMGGCSACPELWHEGAQPTEELCTTLKAQGKESAAASSTVGPWVRGILSFNNVLIYKSHAFFPAWLIVKE